ncbi:hypothetical protein KQI84_10045 [bacterium]|nr:hypothetical protein [bacterium]
MKESTPREREPNASLPWYLPATKIVFRVFVPLIVLMILIDALALDPMAAEQADQYPSVARLRSDARVLQTALDQYRSDLGRYPPSMPGVPFGGLTLLPTPINERMATLPRDRSIITRPSSMLEAFWPFVPALFLIEIIGLGVLFRRGHWLAVRSGNQEAPDSFSDSDCRSTMRRNLAVDSLLAASMICAVLTYGFMLFPKPGHNARILPAVSYATDSDSTWFIIGGRGPDCDIDWPLLKGDQVPTLSTEEVARQLLANPQYTYDPTNGTVSSGDIFRVSDNIDTLLGD